MARKKINGYAFIVYPDSMSKDCIAKLLDNFAIAISPLHNRDKDDNGKLKKPHYHCLVLGQLFSDDKRYISSLTNIYYFEPIYNTFEYYEYLYHWKNGWYIPNKAQYWKGDIKYGCRFNISLLHYSRDEFDIYRILVNCICEKNFSEFCDFIDYCMDTFDSDIISYVLHHQSNLKLYIDSRRYKYLDKYK